MVIYWANENDPNGGTSSQTPPNTCSKEDGAKEKKVFEEKFTGAIPFVGPETSGKNN